MKFGSVCSGIEAASCAWYPLGWRASFLSEIESFPRAVLTHHYPEVPLHGDFTTIKKDQYDRIDVLVGGTPCQSFSVAGLRKGLDDPRGNLMLAYLALADKCRPDWLVWENVPGVLSSNGGRDFGTLLGGLGQLGYGFAYRVLDAQYFGVTQRRRRVFVVGCLGDWRRAAAVLFERHSLQGHPAPRRQAGKAAPTIPSRSSAGGGLGTDFDCDGGLITDTITATYGEQSGQDMMANGLLQVAHTLKGEGFDASEDGTGRGTPLVPVHTTGAGFWQEGFGTLRGRPQDSHENLAIAFDCKASGQSGFGIGEIASTQRAMGHANSHTNGGGHQAVMTASAVRRLTPRECERLQGFRDDYTLIPVRGKPAADGPRYKALGNSMAVPVMAWIGQRIKEVSGIERLGRAA